MTTPDELAPGIFALADPAPPGLLDAVVDAAEAADPFRRTDGATLYEGVTLPEISMEVSQEFDAWLRDAIVPVIEQALGIEVELYALRDDDGEWLPSSPFTFVTRYSEQTQVATQVHRDSRAYGTLVMSLNDAFEGGGTLFPDDNVWHVAPKGSGLIFSGREKRHAGVPIFAGVRYITTTWFHARRSGASGS